MASLKDAETARTQWSDRLTQAGAHSISVEAESPGGRSYVVVAWVEKPPTAPLPTTIEVKRSGSRRSVPLRIRMAEPFAPQTPVG